MESETPAQRPEGRLIAEKASDSGLSVRRLAANAGISDTRWRHIVKGWQPAPGSVRAEVKAPAETLARMAAALGLNPEDLQGVGRDDAAKALREMRTRRPALIEKSPSQVDEIDLIYRSNTMSDKDKLEAIRKVLELRARIEAQAGVASGHGAAYDATVRTESQGQPG